LNGPYHAFHNQFGGVFVGFFGCKNIVVIA
jgi:hypothetical protein